jgi:hypothetical protein
MEIPNNIFLYQLNELSPIPGNFSRPLESVESPKRNGRKIFSQLLVS